MLISYKLDIEALTELTFGIIKVRIRGFIVTKEITATNHMTSGLSAFVII